MLQDALRQLVDYINVSAQTGGLSAARAKEMMHDVIAASGQISHVEATDCLQTLMTAALFSADDKASLCCMINAKVSFQAVTLQARPETQAHMGRNAHLIPTLKRT